MVAIPTPDSQSGLKALQAMRRERHVLAALEVFRAELGDVFRVQLPGFTPVVMAGPEAARFVLVSGREDLRWRNETDPVTALLRRGVLVVDGEEHDDYRRIMSPSLHRRMLNGYFEAMWRCTDRVIDAWPDGGVVDMLVEMRKIALLILMEALYSVDMGPDLRRMWEPILKSIEYISPGLWLIWRGAPRPGYARRIHELDEYLYRIIRARRAAGSGEDLLGALIDSGLDDGRIRDQLLTMLIAGHDTSTANLSWALWLLGKHPESLAQVVQEVDRVLGGDPPGPEQIVGLTYTGQAAQEALRLYPPIHLGNRVAARDIEYGDYVIPAGERVIYSIYLTQRHPAHWENPAAFKPERFAPGVRHEPYTFLPFGGGPRNCIGGAFAQVEVKAVLARILQRFSLELLPRPAVHPYMGATLEPRPGVMMRVTRRQPL
ncbi:MAG: cytochrome P450 [Anaerolineae bacterium]